MALVESFSGIRGIFGRDIDEDIASRYAYSFISFLRQKTKKNNPKIVIGRDPRPSGQRIMDSIIELLDCDFFNVGIASTPCVEFAVRHFNADGGVMITASHNEPYWNGFKFLGEDGTILNPNEMSQVIVGKNHLKNFHKIQLRKTFEKNKEAVEEYSKFVLETIGKENINRIKSSKLKVLIDPNGGSGIIAKNVIDKAEIKFSSINMDYGNFSRKVEPTQESLVYLKNDISQNDCDFAVGFDCDADRAEIVLPNGRLVSGNEILAIIVDYYLSKSRKRETVVVNDATSNVVREICQKYKAKLIEVEVGETNVVSKMAETKSIIGGEGSSGGVIVPPSKCRDGILSMLLVMSIVSEKEKRLIDVINELPRYYNLKTKIEFNEKDHDNIKKRLKSHYSNYKIQETGGIKGGLKIIVGDNSFVWFRASKTEGSVFRIIVDSNDEKKAQELLKEATNIFDKINGKRNN